MNLCHNRECASINGSGGAVRVSSASSLLSQHIEGVIEVENSLLVRLTASQGAYTKLANHPLFATAMIEK